jgi:prevent-host-death family protein
MNAGVRDLKTHLSAYLRRVKDGEQVIITDHGQPCAVLQPFPPRDEEAQLRVLAGNPNVSWSGPRFAFPDPVALGGKSMSDRVLEDRG